MFNEIGGARTRTFVTVQIDSGVAILVLVFQAFFSTRFVAGQMDRWVVFLAYDFKSVVFVKNALE